MFSDVCVFPPSPQCLRIRREASFAHARDAGFDQTNIGLELCQLTDCVARSRSRRRADAKAQGRRPTRGVMGDSGYDHNSEIVGQIEQSQGTTVPRSP